MAEGEKQSSKARASNSLPDELMRIIVNHIKTHGPVPLPRYIGLCLGHPTLGYYTKIADRYSNDRESAVIGKGGDFITSPEISQVFGELLAVWYITQWQAQGMLKETRLVELGPGRGTLLDDMLRTFSSIGVFGKTLKTVHLVETSPYMRKLQEAKLKPWQDKGIKVEWHDTIGDVPAGHDGVFTMLVAHEFFDALPIHIFEKRAEGFREVFVDISKQSISTSKLVLSGNNNKTDPRIVGGSSSPQASSYPKLRFVASPSATLASRLLARDNDERFQGLSLGTRVEVCPDMPGIAAKAAELVSTGGAGLVIDYGDNRFFNHSFRAFKSHQLADPLEDPGSVDLTSNVDFAALRDALTSGYTGPEHNVDEVPADTTRRGIFVPPLQSQRSFLLSLGLQLRVEQLVKNASSDDRRQDIITAAQRLVEKNEKIHGMGKTFKVLSFVPEQEQSADKQEVFPFGTELD